MNWMSLSSSIETRKSTMRIKPWGTWNGSLDIRPRNKQVPGPSTPEAALMHRNWEWWVWSDGLLALSSACVIILPLCTHPIDPFVGSSTFPGLLVTSSNLTTLWFRIIACWLWFQIWLRKGDLEASMHGMKEGMWKRGCKKTKLVKVGD